MSQFPLVPKTSAGSVSDMHGIGYECHYLPHVFVVYGYESECFRILIQNMNFEYGFAFVYPFNFIVCMYASISFKKQAI